MFSAPHCARSRTDEARAGTVALHAAGRQSAASSDALRELQRVAPAPIDVVALPAGAPSARSRATGGAPCACVRVGVPTGALSDDPTADLALHRGCLRAVRLCKANLPREGDRLTPQLDLRPGAREARVLKTEEPFPCVRCGKPFGVRARSSASRQARGPTLDVPGATSASSC